MGRKQISVQMAHTYMNRVEEVAQNLEKAGMVVQDQIVPLGHFRGVADAEQIESLKVIPGVAAVKVIGDEGEAEKDEYSISKND